MASGPAVIVISSSDEDDDVVVTGENRATSPRTMSKYQNNSDKENDSSNDSVTIMEPPAKSEFKVCRKKLQLLKNEWKRVDKDTSSNAVVCSINKSPEAKFKINKARLRKLKAVIRVELQSSPKKFGGVKIKDEKMDTTKDLEYDNVSARIETPPCSQVSPCSQTFINGPTHSSPVNCRKNESPSKRGCQNVPMSPIKKLKQSPINNYFHPHSQKSAYKRTLSWESPTNSAITCSQKELPVSPVFGNANFVPNNDFTNNSSRELATGSQTFPGVTGTTDFASANRNELVWPPSHVILKPLLFIRKCFNSSKTFCTYYLDTIDSLLDEKLFFDFVGTVQSFMSSHMVPPPDLIWLLVKDVLLKSQNSRLSFLIYCVMNEIHNKFPLSCLQMKIEWSHIQDLCDSLHTSDTDLEFLNSKLALLFLLTVLSTEVKSVSLKSKATRITKVFSVDYDTQIIKKVIAGLRRCLCDEENIGGKSILKDGKGTSTFDDRDKHSVDFYQSLLKFVVVLSFNKEYVPIRIANELMYLYIDLSSLQSRALLLQTLQSHLVRRYLIEVLLMNYCSLLPGALQGSELPLSAKKIILQDFQRTPPRRVSENDDCWMANEVEEYVMLLAYLLQDYVASHSMVQACHGDYPIFKEEKCKWFTDDDLNVLDNLKIHVAKLRTRCEGFLQSNSLSLRTCLLLEMVEMLS